MQVSIYTLSTPPEMEIEGKFFNRTAIFIPEFKMVDYVDLPIRGLKAFTAYRGEIEIKSNGRKQQIVVSSIENPTSSDLVEISIKKVK